MIDIDGSRGEGGGQVLRTALSLAMITGQELSITNIRANRSKPGLAPQHLTAVKAAAKVSGGKLDGVRRGSTELSFTPGEVRPGRYRFDIDTAGAATLVLQTIYVPLSLAERSSTVTITGGTHVNWSPCFHYLEMNWLPTIQGAGFSANLTLDRAGYYPKGGGRLTARIHPAPTIMALDLSRRGELKRIQGISAVSNLSLDIAKRQRRQARRQLSVPAPIGIRLAELPAPSTGTVLLLLAEFEHTRGCYFSLGAPGKPAERVSDEAVDDMLAFINSGAAVDRYLADQVILPMALASGESRLVTDKITQHLLTNAAVIQEFLPVDIQIQGEEGQPGEVAISPR